MRVYRSRSPAGREVTRGTITDLMGGAMALAHAWRKVNENFFRN